MKGLWPIARREYAAFFRTPLGWIVAALFLFLAGIIFAKAALVPGQPASMREFFSFAWRILIVVCPAISMRLFSEEHRSGTIDALLAAPVSEVAVVVGKYLGALAFLATCLLPTVLHAGLLFVLSKPSSPDVGPIIAGYLGVALLGMLYLAIGMLFSALTSSQTLAFLATLFTIVLVEFGSVYLAGLLPPPWNAGALALSTDLRIGDFSKGLIDTAHVAYFLIMSAWLVALAAVVLRVRRWR